MRILPLAALLLIAAPAVAQMAAPAMVTLADIKKGRTLKDSGGNRVGNIDRVLTADDGAVTGVRVIYDDRFVTIPADKLIAKDGSVATTLTRREVAKLN